jgi:hypothetical protein
MVLAYGLSLIGTLLLLVSAAGIAGRLHSGALRTSAAIEGLRDAIGQWLRRNEGPQSVTLQPDPIRLTATIGGRLSLRTPAPETFEDISAYVESVRTDLREEFTQKLEQSAQALSAESARNVEAALAEFAARYEEALTPRPFEGWTRWTAGLGVLLVLVGEAIGLWSAIAA